MPEQLRTASTAMTMPPSLFFADAEVSVATLAVTLAQPVQFNKGDIVSAAATNGTFDKFAAAAIPAATDVVGVILESKLTAAGDVTHYIAIKGSFVEDALLAGFSPAPDAAQKAALVELLLKQGIYMVPTAG